MKEFIRFYLGHSRHQLISIFLGQINYKNQLVTVNSLEYMYFRKQSLAAETFASSLDPDQDRHKVGPDLDPNHLKS